MAKKDIIFNSIPRCGNTFLDFCFAEAIRVNFEGNTNAFYESMNVYPHLHFPFLLKLNENIEDVIQFTIYRHPYQQIPSSFALPHYRWIWRSPGVKNEDGLDDLILFAISEQKRWLSTRLENKNSHIILFEELITNPNLILKFIFDVIGIDFKKEIDIEKVKSDIHQYENDMYKDEEERYNMGRLPRDFNKTEKYKLVQSTLLDESWQYHDKYLEVLDLYNQILKIKMGESI